VGSGVCANLDNGRVNLLSEQLLNIERLTSSVTLKAAEHYVKYLINGPVLTFLQLGLENYYLAPLILLIASCEISEIYIFWQ